MWMTWSTSSTGKVLGFRVRVRVRSAVLSHVLNGRVPLDRLGGWMDGCKGAQGGPHRGDRLSEERLGPRLLRRPAGMWGAGFGGDDWGGW